MGRPFSRVSPGPHTVPPNTVAPNRSEGGDDRADDLARFHRAERVVHLVELDRPRDHRPRVQPTGFDEIREPLELLPDKKGFRVRLPDVRKDLVFDFEFTDITFPNSLPEWYFNPREYGQHIAEVPN